MRGDDAANAGGSSGADGNAGADRRGDGNSDPRVPNRPVAFVLASGANLGAVQVGMLRALLEHGIVPDLIVGSSVGAINGVSLAEDPTMSGIARLEQAWRATDGRALLMRDGRALSAVRWVRQGEAINRIDGLRAFLRRNLRADSFAELRVPFHCVAADVDAAREQWFHEGSLVDAVLASAAIPAVFPPVAIGSQRYVDGAVVNDVPVGRAAELGARTIYVLEVGRFSRPRPEPRRPLDAVLRSYWITRRHRYQSQLDALPGGVTVHSMPDGEPPRLPLHDFSRSAELMHAAYLASGAYLEGAAHPGAAAARNETSAPSSAADAFGRWIRRISASPP
jgi:NTE family protein